jgi:hypothetical protein
MVSWVKEVEKNFAKLVLVVETLDRNADADTIAFRKGQCNVCPDRREDKCGICKCYIDIKVATKVNRRMDGSKEITHCPKGRWKDENLVTLYKLIS